MQSIRFYHILEWNEELHSKLFKEYEEWSAKCKEHIYEATKAANWVAEIVRKEINPLFFATKGKFHVIQGPYGNLGYSIDIFEYSLEEKQTHLKENKELK